MKKLNNIDIRQRAKTAGVYQYQIAEALGVSEYTIIRKLRQELSPEAKAKIFQIIDQIAQEEAEYE
ncbi:MAG: hypothetical protein IIZ42_01030 [Eubacterium sp.]|nr:hypothetical protein [Eubacterium sp.]